MALSLGGCGEKLLSTPKPDAAPITVVLSDAAPPVRDTAAGKDSRSDVVLADTGTDTAKAHVGICDHTLENLACWETYDTSRISEGQSIQSIFFDGRYVYYLNPISYLFHGFKYDTTAAFVSDDAWTGFTPGNQFVSMGSDGHYIYLLSDSPTRMSTTGGGPDNVPERFDPQTPNSTQTFNLSKALGTAGAPIPGFKGGAFDGRYMYFVPTLKSVTEASGLAARYDTQADFTSAAGWAVFDMTSVWPNAKGFRGGIFDGRYVYFVPSSTTPSTTSTERVAGRLLVRFDSTGSFQDAKAWQSFDVGTLHAAAAGFSGGTFDGRYVYIAPSGTSYVDSIAVRYDTTASFADAAAFSTFDLQALTSSSGNLAFHGATFDGRYVYFSGANQAMLARFDSTGNFGDSAAWKGFSLYRVSYEVQAAGGIAFDGRYLYVVSDAFGPAMRFDARTPLALPPFLAKFFD